MSEIIKIKSIEAFGELYLCRNDVTRFMDRWIAAATPGPGRDILRLVRNTFEEFTSEEENED